MPTAGDGRWLYYDYDDYGDLMTVTLPDESTCAISTSMARNP